MGARRPGFRFRLEMFREDGRCVRDLALGPPDFARAVEAATLAGLRHAVFTSYEPPFARARLAPRFEEPGSPHALGFTVVLPRPEGGVLRTGFPSGYFRSRARRVRAELVRAREVAENEEVRYRLAAFRDAGEEVRGGAAMLLEEASVTVPVRERARGTLGPGMPWDSPSGADLPVLIPRAVVEEAVAEARRVPERETGGVLLGHLARDPAGGAFLHVTVLVPAEETVATGVSITFTGATWARAREVVELRGEGEVVAGWFHSHPFGLCRQCPLPTPPECVDKVLFFSREDELLHETLFPRAFQVALLAAVEPRIEAVLGHLPVRLFGWRGGELGARGFEVIEG